MRPLQRFQIILDRLQEQQRTYERERNEFGRALKDAFKPTSNTKETRARQTQRLIEIARECVNLFNRDTGELTAELPQVNEIEAIADECTSLLGTSILNGLATSLSRAIQDTPFPYPKETWRGVKSQAILFGDELAVNARSAAYQVAIQALSEMPGGYNSDFTDPGIRPLLELNLAAPSDFTSCHPTAIGIRGLMGQPETIANAGGAGSILRQQAIDLASRSLQSPNKLYVIQVKATATSDGHSFSLLMNHDGTVSVIEGWAMSPKRPNATAVIIWRNRDQNRPRYLSVNDTLGYLNDILSDDEPTRDRGYGNLSAAYGLPESHPAHHFEEANTNGDHDVRNNHSIEVTVAELRPANQVRTLLQGRLNEVLRLRSPQNNDLAEGRVVVTGIPANPMDPLLCGENCGCYYCTDHVPGNHDCATSNCQKRNPAIEKPY